MLFRSRVLVVESFPAVLNWRLDIRFTCDARCTVACDAHVLGPGGRPLSTGHLKFVAEGGSDREQPAATDAARVRTRSVRTIHLRCGVSLEARHQDECRYLGRTVPAEPRCEF